MTISSETSKNIYDGNDSTTVFPYTFKIVDEDHLTVIHTDADGVETTLVLGTDYSLTGVGEESGGEVTYPLVGSPLPTGEKITLAREVPLLQLTDYNNQGGYYPETTEDQFDLDTMMAQQLQEQIDRCVKVDISSEIDPDTLLDEITAAVAAAAASAAAAAVSAAAALVSENAAAASAAAALVSENAAAASAAAALASESAAAASAAAALASENAAAASAAAALVSENAAAASAAAALVSENAAAASAAAALASENAAAASAAAALASENAAAASAAAALVSEQNAAGHEENCAAMAGLVNWFHLGKM